MQARHRDRGRTKFEEDIKVPFVTLYSYSTTQPIDDEDELQCLNDIARLFPDIADRLEDFRGKEAIGIVNDFTARELVLANARLVLCEAPSVEADCAQIAWYPDRAGARGPVAVEFSFRYGDRDEDYDGAVARAAHRVFTGLQTGLKDWVDLKGKTKTRFVYG
jgi:hypothetical protein